MFPRKVGSAWEILAPAKLNLYLEVLGKRADGFHALETLMLPVRIYDQLRWVGKSSGDSPTLRIRDLTSQGGGDSRQLLGNSDDNLVLRAARLLAETAGIEPHGRFDLIKRIPIQAGMGGGSSDAAATLLLANAAWKVGYSRKQLLPLATQLGSDVPFFLNHGATVCRGRGELMEPVARMPHLHFVVVKPPASLSTAEVFGQLPRPTGTAEELSAVSRDRLSRLLTALQCGNLAVACENMTNRLELAAQRLAPWLAELRETLARLDCMGHFMTGSGSAYVGVLRSAKQAQSNAKLLSGMNLAGMNLGKVYATSSC